MKRMVIPSWVTWNSSDEDSFFDAISDCKCQLNQEFDEQCDLEGEERDKSRKEFLKNKGFYLADMES